LDVEDVDATIRAVQEAGGEVVVAKHAIPGYGWLFYFLDTEGNQLGAMQVDSSAA
jgi:predicted enzyme related to lactoylglutathione lyase